MSVPPNAGQPSSWGPPAGNPYPESYPSYGQPSYAQPTHVGPPPAGWYPAPGDPPRPPARPGTNGFAIAALVLGIIGGVLLSVIFGFVALSQIKKSGQNGRGLAIAGLVISGVWTLLIAVILVVAVATTPTRNDAGEVTSGGTISTTDLQVGDCVNDVKDSTSLQSLPSVPCAQPHQGEVYAVFDLPFGAFPGLDSIREQAQTECSSRLEAYSPSALADPDVGVVYVYPYEKSWAEGDREIDCIATAENGTTTGSIRGK